MYSKELKVNRPETIKALVFIPLSHLLSPIKQTFFSHQILQTKAITIIIVIKEKVWNIYVKTYIDNVNISMSLLLNNNKNQWMITVLTLRKREGKFAFEIFAQIYQLLNKYKTLVSRLCRAVLACWRLRPKLIWISSSSFSSSPSSYAPYLFGI